MIPGTELTTGGRFGADPSVWEYLGKDENGDHCWKRKTRK